jgi:hypothetical protein
MIEPVRVEAAACESCDWRDDARGARGRGAKHARRLGHKVVTTLETTWPATAPPGAEPFPELDLRLEQRAPYPA